MIAFAEAPYDPPPITEAQMKLANREQMRLALEAAAPHMLAAAFGEAADAFGEAASWSDGRPSPEQVQRWLHSRANTYRSTR